jgi:hypothetical protein
MNAAALTLPSSNVLLERNIRPQQFRRGGRSFCALEEADVRVNSS